MSQSNSSPKSAGVNVSDTSTCRSNPEIDAKIDAYIRENPTCWAYIQGLSRDHLERTVALNELQNLEYKE